MPVNTVEENRLVSFDKLMLRFREGGSLVLLAELPPEDQELALGAGCVARFQGVSFVWLPPLSEIDAGEELPEGGGGLDPALFLPLLEILDMSIAEVIAESPSETPRWWQFRRKRALSDLRKGMEIARMLVKGIAERSKGLEGE